MPKLNSSMISESSVASLALINIYSTLDFIKADVDKIVSNSELDEEAVLNLKHKLTTDYSAAPITGIDCYVKSKSNYLIKTHILGIDRLLDGGLAKGSIVEFCGPVSCGKTQVCHSIAVNVAATNGKVDYIDTKCDFSATRCNKLLPDNLEDKEMDRILENIKVYNPNNIYNLISTLDYMKSQYQDLGDSERVLIIDSLTAPYLPLVGITSRKGRNKGLSLLNYIASCLKELATTKNLAVIITNLGVKYFEAEEEEQPKKDPYEIKPLLGKYWLHVPNTRVLISRETPLSAKRSLCIQKSDCIQLNKTEKMIIAENGVT